jgi:5-methylcytosine-specific restriction endonuclease McrA
MRESLVPMWYFETYYYANIIQNVLNDTMAYARNLNDWHEDREVGIFLQPFKKWSILHDISCFIIESLISETLNEPILEAIANNDRSELWVDKALRRHGFETEGFRGWAARNSVDLSEISEDDVHLYHQDLSDAGDLEKLLSQLSNEVFFLLFGNRLLLQRLNSYVAGLVNRIERADLPKEYLALLARDGVPARVHIPEWVRRAVFFRDRGMCACCNTDLSGLVTTHTEKHFDHIIPLAEGGVNDVTNIQLLCGVCNLTKGRRIVGVSNHYEAWYT